MGKIELYDFLIENLENYFNDDIDGYEEELIKISLLSKYIKTLKAIKLLDINGYFEDAIILSRSLFEILVTVAYCECHNLYLRFSNYSFVTRKEFLDLLLQRGTEVPQEDVIAINTMYERFKETYNISNNRELYTWNGISFKNTVQDVVLNYKCDYLNILYEAIYKVASGFTHSGSLSALNYIGFSEVENQIVDYKIDAFPDENYMRVVEDIIRINDIFINIFRIKSVAKV